MEYLCYDLIILALLVLFIFLGYKQGFVLALCGFLAMFVAFGGATFLSNLLCEPVGRLVQPMIETTITETLEKTVDSGKWQLGMPPVSTNDDKDQLPVLPLNQALKALENSKLYRTFGASLEKALREGVLKATAAAVPAIAGYIAREVARMILFSITFVVILLGWWLLSHILDLAFRLPVLSTVNQGIGGVMGFVKGALVIWILCWLLRGTLIPQEAVEHTLLLKLFSTFSPLSMFLGE